MSFLPLGVCRERREVADSFCGHDFDMNEGGNPLKFGLALYGCFKKKIPQKWMVYNGKPYFSMDDLGVPLFSETSIYKENGFFQCFQIQEVVNYSR